MLGKAISKNSIVLGLFAVVTTAGIAGTYLSTRDAIVAQERAAQARALLQVVPQSRHDNSMLDDTLPVSDKDLLNLAGEQSIFVARKSGAPVAYIIPAIAPDGYSGQIKLIVGVNTDGSIAGVRILAHNETPGLGDKVDLKKSDWVLGFNDRSLHNPAPELWKVTKDKGVFDTFTGATITPRAVTNAVYQTLLYYQANAKTMAEQTRQEAAEVPAPQTDTAPVTEEPANG